VIVAALYRHHKWLIRGLVAAFVCETIWVTLVWSVFYPRSAPLNGACDIVNLAAVKWCFLAAAYVSHISPSSPVGMMTVLLHRTPQLAIDSLLLLLTIYKVVQMSRAPPRIPLLQLLLRDALWAFSLIWGWIYFIPCYPLLTHARPSAVLLLSEAFVIANLPVGVPVGIRCVASLLCLRDSADI
jgi:hypothetical protein